jgi:hypothetical protein
LGCVDDTVGKEDTNGDAELITRDKSAANCNFQSAREDEQRLETYPS